MIPDATDLFFDARLKIKRANQHIADAKAAILSLEEETSSSIEKNTDTGSQQINHIAPELESSLRELSLIVGDALHNLRSALDFAWHSTMERHHIAISSKRHRKFPACETPAELERILKKIEIDCKFPKLFELMVSEIQPYKGGKNGIVHALNELDVSDKHLVLLNPIPWATIRNIVIRDENGNVSKGRGATIPAISKLSISFGKNIKIEDKGQLSFAVTIEEAGIFKSIPINSLLSDFSKMILYFVIRLESL